MKTIVGNSRQNLLWFCGLVAACSMIVPSAGAQSTAPRISAEITNAAQSTLKNSLHPLAQAQFDAGRMRADTRINGISMVFARSAAQEADLQALIAAQQNRVSPLYHQWLDPDEFAARFGMAAADLNKVENWLQQQGFAIDSVARSKNVIRFSGAVRQVESTFQTEMHLYKINGVQHFAPATELSVPAALAPTVLSIGNLDDFRPKSHVVFGKNARVKPAFTSAQTGDVFFAPGDIVTVYDIKPVYNAGYTGTGQSITLVGQSAIQVSDIEAFQNAAGLTVKDPTQFLVPNSGTSTVEADGDEAESDIDLEWSGAIAPGATINFVYAGNNPNYGAFDAIIYAIDEKIGTIISSSYGECEAALPLSTLGSGQLVEPTLESAFEQGIAQGQTFMAAAGDDGSTDCYGTTGLTTAQQELLAVDYPASSQYVTGMGGTEISSTADSGDYLIPGDGYWATAPTSDVISSALQHIPEVAWNDDAPNCGEANCLSATGGGASTLYTSKPSWQKGPPGIPSDGKRDVPDLALYASPSFPGYLYCTSDTSTWTTAQQGSCAVGFRDSNAVYLTLAGGTSFDGPIFSGILALISQKAGYTAGQGLVNPTLYTLASNSATYASAFHDITTGNNDCLAGSANCNGDIGFSAGTGYDQVTGLGSVDASNLANAWPANTVIPPTLIDTTTTIAASNSAPDVGVSDNFTISVTANTGAGTPTGTLTLTVDTNAPITEDLTSNGTYVYPYTFTTAGSHVILAAYSGDSTYAASTGSVTVTVQTASSGKGTIALAASPSTLTVSQGNSGTETISVTPGGGYTGTVDVSFDTSNDSALQNLCYEFTNMNSAGDGLVSISGPGAVTTQLILDANATDCVSAQMRPGGKQPMHRLHPVNTAKNNGGNPLPLGVAFAGLLLAGFLGRGSRKLRGLAGLILLAAVGLAVTACNNTINNTIPNPPTGTYTITVSAVDSAGSIQATPVTFTFVIN
ncbi:MAG TPA: protease pro-enzyme activation domain-containing protein [Terracidiphilus sp.]